MEENSMVIPQETKHKITIWSSNSISGFKHTKNWKHGLERDFTSMLALLTIAKR